MCSASSLKIRSEHPSAETRRCQTSQPRFRSSPLLRLTCEFSGRIASTQIHNEVTMNPTTLIIIFIILIVVFGLVVLLLGGGLNTKLSFIETRLGVAGDTLVSITQSALSEANSITGQAFDFANTVVNDLNAILQAIANSIAQILQTLGAAFIDVINTVASIFETQNAALTAEIQALFSGLLIPIFDTINNIINTIVSVVVTTIGTFNPNKCP